MALRHQNEWHQRTGTVTGDPTDRRSKQGGAGDKDELD